MVCTGLTCSGCLLKCWYPCIRLPAEHGASPSLASSPTCGVGILRNFSRSGGYAAVSCSVSVSVFPSYCGGCAVLHLFNWRLECALYGLPAQVHSSFYQRVFFSSYLCSTSLYILGNNPLLTILLLSHSLRPRGLQHARLPCPSLSPRVCSNVRPLSL